MDAVEESSAFVYCVGENLDKASSLKFYVKANGSTKSVAASLHQVTYAQAEFSNLTPNTEYTLYAEAVDALGNSFKSPEIKFTTKEASASPSYGWLELPAKSDIPTAKEYAFKAGERNYTAYYDTDTYSSLWVAYPLAKGHSGSLSRSSKWYFADGITQTDQVDLCSSSYSGNYSRGHQIPNGDRNGNSAMQKQAFYVINSTPQIQNGFNGGIWNNLENAIRDAVPASDTLYIATGPVYQTVGGSESVSYTTAKDDTKQCPVPNYYFKVVMKVKRSASGDITDAMAVGFWFKHKVYSSSDYEQCEISVDEIEAKTGYDFFANLPPSIESSAERNGSWTTFTSF